MDCGDAANVAMPGNGAPVACFRVPTGGDVAVAFQQYLKELEGPVNVCYQATLDSTTMLQRVLLDAEFECSQLYQASRSHPGSSIAAPLLGVCQGSLDLARARICHAASEYLQQLQQGHNSCLEAMQAQGPHTASLLASLSKQQESLVQRAGDIAHERQRESQSMQMLAAHKDTILKKLDRERRHLRARTDKLKGTSSILSSLVRLISPLSIQQSPQLAQLQASLDEIEKDEQQVLRNFSSECKRFAEALRQLDVQSVDCASKRNDVLDMQKRLAAQSEMAVVMVEQSQLLAKTLSNLQERLVTAVRDGYMQAKTVLPKLQQRLEELEQEVLRCNQELQGGQPSEGIQTYQRAAVTRLYLLVTQVRLQRVEQVVQCLDPACLDILQGTQGWVVEAVQEQAQIAEIRCLCQQWALKADPTVVQPDWMWASAMRRQSITNDADRPSRSSSQAGITERVSRASSRQSVGLSAIQAFCGVSSHASVGATLPHSSLTSPASRMSSIASERPWLHNTAPAFLRIPQTSLQNHGSLSPPVSRESSMLSTDGRSHSVHSVKPDANTGVSLVLPARRGGSSVTSPAAEQLAATAISNSANSEDGPDTPRISPPRQQSLIVNAACQQLCGIQDEDCNGGSFSQYVTESGMQALQARLPPVAVNKHLSRLQGSGRKLSARPQAENMQSTSSHLDQSDDVRGNPVSQQTVEDMTRGPVVIAEFTSGGLTGRHSTQSDGSSCSAGSFSFWDPFMAATTTRLGHSNRLSREASVTASSATDSPTAYQAVSINAGSLELNVEAIYAEAETMQQQPGDHHDDHRDHGRSSQHGQNNLPEQQPRNTETTPVLLNDLFEVTIL